MCNMLHWGVAYCLVIVMVQAAAFPQPPQGSVSSPAWYMSSLSARELSRGGGDEEPRPRPRHLRRVQSDEEVEPGKADGGSTRKKKKETTPSFGGVAAAVVAAESMLPSHDGMNTTATNITTNSFGQEGKAEKEATAALTGQDDALPTNDVVSREEADTAAPVAPEASSPSPSKASQETEAAPAEAASNASNAPHGVDGETLPSPAQEGAKPQEGTKPQKGAKPQEGAKRDAPQESQEPQQQGEKPANPPTTVEAAVDSKKGKEGDGEQPAQAMAPQGGVDDEEGDGKVVDDMDDEAVKPATDTKAKPDKKDPTTSTPQASEPKKADEAQAPPTKQGEEAALPLPDLSEKKPDKPQPQASPNPPDAEAAPAKGPKDKDQPHHNQEKAPIANAVPQDEAADLSSQLSPAQQHKGACDPEVDCSGNGKCQEEEEGSGSCLCDPRWSGPTCTFNLCAEITLCDQCVTMKDKKGGSLGCYWWDGECKGDGKRAPDMEYCPEYEEEEGLFAGVGQYLVIGLFGMVLIGFLLWRARSRGGLFGNAGGSGGDFQPVPMDERHAAQHDWDWEPEEEEDGVELLHAVNTGGRRPDPFSDRPKNSTSNGIYSLAKNTFNAGKLSGPPPPPLPTQPSSGASASWPKDDPISSSASNGRRSKGQAQPSPQQPAPQSGDLFAELGMDAKPDFRESQAGHALGGAKKDHSLPPPKGAGDHPSRSSHLAAADSELEESGGWDGDGDLDI